MRFTNLLLAVALLGAVSVAAPGCSSEQTSTTTTQTTAASPYDSSAQSDSSQPPPPAAMTTTTTTTNNEPDSVLGAAFHLVGTIILLPFRVIGLLV
jgi:hypothetical protein